MNDIDNQLKDLKIAEKEKDILKANKIKTNADTKNKNTEDMEANFISPSKKIKVSFKLNDKKFKRTGTFNTKPKNSFKECKKFSFK